jgi:hypothetical protein
LIDARRLREAKPADVHQEQLALLVDVKPMAQRDLRRDCFLREALSSNPPIANSPHHLLMADPLQNLSSLGY